MAVPVGRLLRRADFLRVAATRRKWSTPGMVVQAADNPGTDLVRVGFTVTKKIGNAVVRNRARRRLRAAAAAVLPDRATPGQDYVLIGRADTTTRPYPALLADLGQALERLRTPR